MIKAGLSPTRLRRKVLALCAEANYVGDIISELAHEARDQQQALLLAPALGAQRGASAADMVSAGHARGPEDRRVSSVLGKNPFS